ncbi:N-acetylmuramoyl-L-alanine amidase CwlD [Phosphitispora sp. TUW77]|uniref:N-acetylmuramoyl-L-alanine amidase CwlD n=1 Tax=Phosphitispora sp. TUW77 TaxID=3152361 RepID=UPI003AB2EF82
MRLIYIKTLRVNKFCLLVVAAALAMSFYCLSSVTALNKTVPATSWAVANRLIVIDPGHGGIDPGAVGHNGLLEKELVLDIGKRMQNILNQAGADVIMTRTTDIELNRQKREDLSMRVGMANSKNADLYISIHVNSFPSSRWRGAQTFYQKNQPESKKLAEAIQSELIRVMKNTTRKAKPEDYYTTRNTKMPAVIVEIGFISNPAEAKLMSENEYQRKLAYAIYSGIAKYYAEKTSN